MTRSADDFPRPASGRAVRDPSSRVVAATAATAAAGAAACGVLCVLPFALPAFALAGTSGAVAWLARAQGGMTVLASEPERVLRYNHWSVLSRLADSADTRTVITLTLTPEGDETHLEVRHDNLASYEAFGHARFFWRTALLDVRDIAESA